jgi:hypothetical protein
MKRLFILILGMLLPLSVWAGGGCVVAKRQGDSLAIEWEVSPTESAASALAKVTQKLIDQGFRKKGQDVHTQASTDLPHAYLVIVKTVYTTVRGKSRTSYGCGFSPRSLADAEQAALYNLRNYSWGWKPEFGYEVIENTRY